MESMQNDRIQEMELHHVVELTRDLDTGLCDIQKSFVQCTSGSNTTVSLANLCNSGNAFVDKIVIVFASLATEVDFLNELARNKFYPGLLLYGEEVDTNNSANEVTPIKFMTKFLPFLQETNLFVGRCFEVCRNILLQIYGFYSLSNQYMEKAADRQLWRGWRILGDVLVILITLDEIISSHNILIDQFKTYQRSIELAQFNPTQFGVSTEDGRLKALFNLISEIELKIFQGNTFVACCQQHFSNEIPLNKQFMERLKTIISDSLVRWDRVAQEDIPDKHRLMVLCALSVFYYTINQTKTVDKKLLKTLTATQKRIMAFHLIGDILFTPIVFIQQKLPSKISQTMDKKLSSPQFLIDAFSTLLDQQAEQLSREVQFSLETVAEWKAEMRSLICQQNTELETSTANGSHANQLVMLRCNTVLKGARLADKMSRLVKCILNCHLFDDRPISKSNAHNIFRLIELIKSVLATINFHWPSIVEWVMHASLFLSSRIVRNFEAIRSEFNAKASNPYLVDVISALKLASLSLAHSPTKSRLFVCGFALEVAHYTKNFRLSEVIETDELMQRLDSILNISLLFKRVADCSFLYWHRSLCTVYFESLFEDYTINANKILRFFEALDDACSCIKQAKHIESELLMDSFRVEIFETFKESTLDRLCAEIENDLRLTIHERQNVLISKMESDLLKPKQIRGTSLNNSALIARMIELLQMPHIVLAGHSLSIKNHVEDRMDKTFYELTAVALHDSESYAQMRILAAERYKLRFIKNNLPYMEIDQGLDLLRIVTNMGSFVTNFNYDFNEQMFIEKSSKSKMLNIIRVPNAVSSIKTHGFGILNSTINFAYRTLAKKFRAFSRFLFDDQIKGQLVKDIRYYRDSIDDLKQMYPVKRAERFNNAVAKLGVSANGQTYLDGFRELLTQIGNIVGFVRMVQSTAAESNDFMDECANSLPFDLGEKVENPSSLNNSLGSNYLDMLVSVFTKEFRNIEKFGHLRNFFIIVPPLCINYVEHIIASRLRLGKRIQIEDDLTFVDDGFSLGIAYVLTLLNQVYFFSSLNWFQSVDISLQRSQESVVEEQKAAQRNKDESYAQTLAIRLKRLQDFQTEFHYLNHTLNAAIMIFKSKDSDVNQEESFLEDF